MQKRLLSLMFLVTLLYSSVKCQTLSNFRYHQSLDTLIVMYDINSARDDIFRVRLLLSNDGGSNYPIIPWSTKGDVGYGIHPGVNKKILWFPLKDSIELSGDNYQFKIEVKSLGTSPKIEFVQIPGGEYDLGSFDKSSGSDEYPPHSVLIDGFELSKYEVTNLQFANFLNAYGNDEVKEGEFSGKKMIYDSPYGMKQIESGNRYWTVQKGYEFHPVTNVTWFGAYEFCRYYNYKLPSEAEWEYAARELGKKIKYGNGRQVAENNEINFSSGESTKSMGTTHVASFAPNSLELFDLSGNVWEWCQDWYNSDSYSNTRRDNPVGPTFGNYKVIRGGSWYNNSEGIRTTERSFIKPDRDMPDIGFRVAKSIGNK